MAGAQAELLPLRPKRALLRHVWLSGGHMRELKGDCHESVPVSEAVALHGDVRGFLIAPELMCLLLTPGAPRFNYCLRSHVQMSLLSSWPPRTAALITKLSCSAARMPGWPPGELTRGI